MKVQQIPYQSIRADPRWVYRLDKENPTLTKSLKLKGILTPLILLQEKNEFMILDGFKRYRFLRGNSSLGVPAAVYARDEAKDALLHSLSLNVTNQLLSTVEKSNVTKIIQSFENRDFQSIVCNFLEIPPKKQFIQKYLSIHRFPSKVKFYFHAHQFSLRQIERITSIPILSLSSWIRLAAELNIKAQELVNLVEIIGDISIKENISVHQLYQKLNIDKLLKQQSAIQQKSASLKSLLYQKRYPMLSGIQKKVTDQISRIRKNSELPIQISWDKSLEQTGYWLNIYLEHQKAINELHNFLASPQMRDDLKKLFEIITHSLEDSNETP